MNAALLGLLGLWLGTTAAIVGGILWSTRMETLAELPDTAPHREADCIVCLWASDVGVIAAIDFDLWNAQCQERAS